MILLYPNTHDIGEYSSTIIDNQKNTFSIISKIHQLDFTFKTLFSLDTQYYQWNTIVINSYIKIYSFFF